MNKPVHFLFYSRLEEEKGFRLLLEVMSKFIEIAERNFRISIFATGSMESELKIFMSRHPEFPLTYYGRRPKREIFSFMKSEQVDIVLMPSLFLETFGLNSGEALWHGIPVLGFWKGGTKQFLLDEKRDIDNYIWDTKSEKLYSAMKELINTYSDDQSRYYRPKAQHCALRYSRQQWKASFEDLLRAQNIQLPQKRILLISDYKERLGGIENYLYDVEELFTQDGYEAELFGGGLSTWRKRKLGLICTACNVWEARKLYRKIKKFKPELIYRNSVHRYLWWFPLLIGVYFSDAKHIVMYHDFGLFHPYPSCVYDEQQLLFEKWFRGFFDASGKSYIWMPVVWCKYISLLLIRKVLQKYMSVHLVPSDYMISLIKHFYMPSTQIKTLHVIV